jgi:two-component system, NarL family, sensor histidine kinase UhpB
MKVASPPLYAKVCLINGAVFAAALTLLVVSPATVAHQVIASELAVLAAGLAVIVVTNAALLHSTLAPLDHLVQLLDTFEASEPAGGSRAGAAGWRPGLPKVSTTSSTGWTPSGLLAMSEN